jgi:EAL domain-containing protein (putative c-di-GMP-specific phosphodiesterase class I)
LDIWLVGLDLALDDFNVGSKNLQVLSYKKIKIYLNILLVFFD